MKLRNKKTGEIIEKYPDRFVINSGEQIRQYDSLAELNEDWEDYEEPIQAYYIDYQGDIHVASAKDNNWSLERIIGNYFETKEEAEEAVEKLKAWKRLKDRDFKFLDYTALGLGEIKFEHNVMDEIEDVEQLEKDLDLLFGGEE